MRARRRAADRRAVRREPPPEGGWTEADSEAFARIAGIAVPARRAQIDMLTKLIPAESDGIFTVVELGAGAGALARAVLRAFPRCRFVALERSPRMRAALRGTLRGFGPRAGIRGFDLAEAAWRHDLPQPLRCVLASLVVHHLPDGGKRQLFADVAASLEPGGAFLLADLVRPANARVQQFFARQWNDAARAQSRVRAGGAAALRRFSRDGWNYYAATDPDPYDQPAALVDQLQWLREAGFGQVDCFWMTAGHAVFGGYLLEDHGGRAGEGNAV